MITRTTAAGAIVPVADLKAHLRVESDHEDALIASFEAAAVSYLEQITARYFGAGASFTGIFPAFAAVALPVGTSAIAQITYFDADGALQTLDPGTYELQAAPVCPVLSVEDPPATALRPDAVTVEFTGGEAATDNIRLCIMCLVSHFFDERGPASVAALRSPDLAGLPQRVRWLIAPERRTGA